MEKLTALNRIVYLLDDGCFAEIGRDIKDGEGVITGYGTIEGRLVYVFSQDFSSNGGAICTAVSKKICNVMDMAVKMGAPLVAIYDSAGGMVEEGLDIFNAYGSIISANARLSGVVPQIAIVAGPCTGTLALSASMCDFTIMVENSGRLYINSSMAMTDEEHRFIDDTMYGSSRICGENGTVQIISKDDKDALNSARKLLNYIPSNNLELPPGMPFKEIDGGKTVNEGMSTQRLIASIVDGESSLELYKDFGSDVQTVLGQIGGMTIGIIANNFDGGNHPNLNIYGIRKMMRMIKLCDCFNIPMLFICDCQGFESKLEEENSGLAMECAKFTALLSYASVPKVSLAVGKIQGISGIMLCNKNTFDMVYSWPLAQISLIEPEKLLDILYTDEILAAEKPECKERQIIEICKEDLTNPLTAARSGHIDGILLPNDTRKRLFSVFDMLSSKREKNYPRKHLSLLV